MGKAIGKIRAIITDYLLQKYVEFRLLSREEFMTMLLHAARIVNSTPLWATADSPNEPQPISPQMLLTQRDDACTQTDIDPNTYSAEQIQAYGARRWQYIEVVAEDFWKEWQQYMYDIGTERTKWQKYNRNAQVGDIVLMTDKQLPRLQWSTATITQIIEDTDGIVRRAVVKPHARTDKATTQASRERAVNDLILIKAFTEIDVPAIQTDKDVHQQTTAK